VVLTVPESAEVAVTQRLTINPRAAGPRLGKEVQAVIRASKNGDWARASDGTMTVGGIVLHDGEYDVSTVVEGGSGTGASGVLPSGGFVVLDTEVTEEMALEGVARDLVRAVQQARRDAGLAVSDRIRLGVDGGDEVMDAADTHREMIMRETLATVLELATVPADSCIDAVVGDGLTVRVTIERTG
jgi:isoleucyl-tRNA synthetase